MVTSDGSALSLLNSGSITSLRSASIEDKGAELKVLVIFSGVYRVFDKGYMEFVNTVVRPNVDFGYSFDILVNTDEKTFCSEKDFICDDLMRKWGECNVCDCIEKPNAADMRGHIENAMKTYTPQDMLHNKVQLLNVGFSNEKDPIQRLTVGWREAQKYMNKKGSYAHVMYLRPDAAPTRAINLKESCEDMTTTTGKGKKQMRLKDIVFILSGEVPRGKKWPLHDRDWDLGALACSPKSFKTYITGFAKTCKDIWAPCRGNPLNVILPPNPLAGTIPNCKVEQCSLVAHMNQTGVLLETMDKHNIFMRIHRMLPSCQLGWQKPRFAID
jgi:hypothetical protein